MERVIHQMGNNCVIACLSAFVSNDSILGHVDLVVRFRDQKQFSMLQKDSFDMIHNLLNECMPSDWYIDDIPIIAHRIERSGYGDSENVDLDLIDTRLYKDTRITNEDYNNPDVPGCVVSRISGEDFFLRCRTRSQISKYKNKHHSL